MNKLPIPYEPQLYYGMDGQPLSRDEAAVVMANDRHIGLTKIQNAVVSTVLLVLDHNLFGDGVPIIFETMVFGDSGIEEEQWRYHTKQEAARGHKLVVDLVLNEHPFGRVRYYLWWKPQSWWWRKRGVWTGRRR